MNGWVHDAAAAETVVSRAERLARLRMDRKPPPKLTPTTPARVKSNSRGFPSQYQGYCTDCGGTIGVGQLIQKADDGYVHKDCDGS